MVLIKDYSVVAQLCMCGDGRVERTRLGPRAVSGKNGPFVAKPQSFKLQVPLENTHTETVELCDEPQTRSGESAWPS